mmetsp:Transcript_3285/g.4465  ORF Transcript_3285/g.4465 Transcript_3285/m.4465 type:complete len:81 (-) Transcript_3285:18-260(-)
MLLLTSIPSISHYLNKSTTKVYINRFDNNDSSNSMASSQGFERIPDHDDDDDDNYLVGKEQPEGERKKQRQGAIQSTIDE